jgi:tetratricopeptide (TPR) repeat protein
LEAARGKHAVNIEDSSRGFRNWIDPPYFEINVFRATIAGVRPMAKRLPLPPIATFLLLSSLAQTVMAPAAAADVSTSASTSGASSSVPPPPSDSTYVGSDNSAKARALVDAAINMTDSNRAVNLLWQATDLDPKLEEAYVYLALYYNSRSQFDRVVQVYQKLVKYRPEETSAWMNIGEAYMSYSPPRFDAALPYYQKALELDHASCFAALRIGEIYAEQNNRAEAERYLRLPGCDRAKNAELAQQADRILHQIGP